MDNLTNQIYKTFTQDFYQKDLEGITDTYQDVQWGSKASQNIRFEYLYKLFNENTSDRVSILDVGCGLGHFYKFLIENNKPDVLYTGLDIHSTFIEFLRTKYPNNNFINKSLFELEVDNKFDYLVASGIFNIGNIDINMDQYLKSSIEKMFNLCDKGIAFNLLSHFTPKHYIGAIETYFNPTDVLDFCFNFTNKINLYHSYRLNDFTIIMYK
ncbi:class I SAM-dependent methyltransferase [Cytobacillus purgationiresistens]|uniref:SAM-dependent methyltransferase n=1 Tax=Cytobacillus purgationiresistens TaxID=863449 RepID=A0ABU0AQ24_9BACI|nr:class I SAM-dependent methyltransferase [Cytobacillus purgationiresistens]MDQ0273387.1 SAM-dependent methyltransferase [Cytobacillus purgationiresistens]